MPQNCRARPLGADVGGVSVLRAANSGVALMEAHHIHGTAYVGARRPGAALLAQRVRK